MNKLLIIDGHNYLYRGYYGVPIAAKLPNGLQINAIYGFFSYLRKNIQYLKPDNVVVVFDTETGIQKKLENNSNYKQNRDYSDTGMFDQLPIIKQALEYMNITYVEDMDNEGDDVIGSISYKEAVGSDIYISTQDQDFFQLISDSTYVLRDERLPHPKIVEKYINNPMKYDRNIFVERKGFSPECYLDYLALKGDPSDNVLGVKGIGKKTALKLVKQYKFLEDILQNSNNKYLKGNEELVKKNKEFLRINCDLDLKYELKDFDKEKILLGSNEILKFLGYSD